MAMDTEIEIATGMRKDDSPVKFKDCARSGCKRFFVAKGKRTTYCSMWCAQKAASGAYVERKKQSKLA